MSYIILQRPVQNITTGANAKFSLMMSTRGNCLFWPDARDSIANGLGQHLLGAAAPSSVVPKLFAGHNVNYIVDTHKDRKVTLIDRIRKALGYLWDHRSQIMAGVGQVASFAAPLLMASGPETQVIVRASYLRSLRDTYADLAYFECDSSFLDVGIMKAEISRRAAILLSPQYAEQRLVPISAFDNETRVFAPQSITPARYSDHATAASQLARYGVERNPGPDSLLQSSDADAVLPI